MSCQGGGKFHLVQMLPQYPGISASVERQSLYVLLPVLLCLFNSVDCSEYRDLERAQRKLGGQVHLWNAENILEVRLLVWSELMFFPLI